MCTFSNLRNFASTICLILFCSFGSLPAQAVKVADKNNGQQFGQKGKQKPRKMWAPQEIIKLRRAVETRREVRINWGIIASQVPGRLPKQCRERWNNHERPNIKKGPLTNNEIETLIRLQEIHGNRWAEIAKEIPDRPPNCLKNAFSKILRQDRADYGVNDEEEESWWQEILVIDNAHQECIEENYDFEHSFTQQDCLVWGGHQSYISSD